MLKQLCLFVFASIFCANWAQATKYHLSFLGDFGGAYSEAYAINDSGQVAGRADSSTAIRAFLYSNGTMSDLGTFGGRDGYAYGINRSGQVAGQASNATTAHAFLYSNGT